MKLAQSHATRALEKKLVLTQMCLFDWIQINWIESFHWTASELIIASRIDDKSQTIAKMWTKIESNASICTIW